MKPLAQMTFEEASKMRAALDAIAHVLDEVGVSIRPAMSRKILTAPGPKVTKKKHKNRGHLTLCDNPGCTRAPGKKRKTYVRRRRSQRFCKAACGVEFFGMIRNYARAIAADDVETQKKWTARAPWLVKPAVPRIAEDVARIIDNVAKGSKRAKRGVTIVKNTPTASARA